MPASTPSPGGSKAANSSSEPAAEGTRVSEDLAAGTVMTAASRSAASPYIRKRSATLW
jgi:hypothetical protein